MSQDTKLDPHDLRRRRFAGVRAAAGRAALLSVLWWALTEGSTDALVFGVGTVGLAMLVSMALHPTVQARPGAPGEVWTEPRARPRLRPFGLLRFVLFFLFGSLRGGIDVAVRALSPRLTLSPTVVVYKTRLTPGLAQNLFLGSLSLMPGTLSIELDDRDIRVHVLTRSKESTAGLAALEERIASAFGLALPERKT